MADVNLYTQQLSSNLLEREKEAVFTLKVNF